ncbi:MAG: TolC family outer membrane protein [Burkholderiaceae bacterium]|nr:TolC family outer membrane protein [Burkholderiaceae bacterium]
MNGLAPSGRRAALAAAVAAAMFSCAPAAWGQGVADLWRAAQQADAQIRAARFELEATELAIPIARAQLLPQIAIAAGDTKINGSRDITDAASGASSSSLDYFSRSRSLSLRMALYNKEASARVDVGEAQVDAAGAIFKVRRKDLALRLGRAYFRLLFALDGVSLAQSAVETFEESVTSAASRLRGGEGTRTEVSEAEARLDRAGAEVIDARDRVDVARRALQMIVGLDTALVQRPPSPTRVLAIDPAGLDEWLARVDNSNPEILARQLQAEVARREVTRARAGHYPRVDMIAALSRSANDSVSTLNTTTSQSSLGLQLNIPLYSGGLVDASTRQALLLVRRSEQDLEAERNTQRVEVRTQFLAVANGGARIEAFEKAVRSAEVALEGTRFGLRAGLRTNLDVLNAQRQVFEARRDLSEAAYNYWLARLQLKAVAGESLDDTIDEIDRALRVPMERRPQVATIDAWPAN